MSATHPEIYLDAAATTPPHPSVIDAMADVQRLAWGNPSSLHRSGLTACESLERSRLSIAGLLGASPEEVIVTSGATESVHLALLGSAAVLSPGRLVISEVEHPAVQAAAERLIPLGWQLQTWPVDHRGLLRLNLLDELLSPPTRLVSLIWGQGEVGAVQPLITIGKACRRQGIRLHTDATQLLPQGRIRWGELPIDLLSCSAHQLQGPRGIGLLLRRNKLDLQPVQGGGGQEMGLRSGTEPVALLAGMVKALSQVPGFDAGAATIPPGAGEHLRHQRDALLRQLLSIDGVHGCGPRGDQRLPHHISLLLSKPSGQPISGRSMVRQLARRGVAVSSGSACSSGRSSDSAVLRAMGIDQAMRQSGLRLTLGPWLTDAQLATVPALFEAAIQAAGRDA